MASADRVIRRFKSALTFRLVLKHALLLITVWAFAYGLVVLVLRAAGGADRVPLLWGLTAVPVAIIAAVVWARRGIPKRQAVTALLDKHSGCSGLLMAADDAELGAWQGALGELVSPRLRWHGRRSWFIFLVAACFAATSFLMPQRYVAIAAPRALDVSPQVEMLKDQIELLEEEKILEPTEAKELVEKLDQLQQEASADDPVKTWEALDHLDETVADKAEKAAADAVQETEALAKAEALSEALQKGADKIPLGLLTEAMSELAGMVEKACEQNSDLAETLGKELLEACKRSNLSSEDLGKLCNALKLSKEQLEELMKKLAEAELIDAELVKLCEGCGKCDQDALLAMLCEEGDCLAVPEMLGACMASGSCPGKGGINRGRGDAPMTWGEESDAHGVQFKEQTLPEASLAALKDSKLVGTSTDAPTVADKIVPTKTGALTGAQAGGGGAVTHTILPRHRGTVKRFFKRQ